MLYALLLMVVVVGIGTLMFARTVNEIKHSGDDAAIIQTLLLARGAANMGGAVMQGAVRAELENIVEADSSTTNRWSFGTGNASSTAPDASSVATALTTGSSSVARKLQTSVDAALCNQAIPLTGAGTAWFRVYFTDSACGVALPASVQLPAGRFVSGIPRGKGSGAEQVYALPFVLVAEGSVGTYNRNVVAQGEYRFEVGRASFAKYALFTNVHTTGPNGNDIWFTDRTLFDGPVHTNNYFRFYDRPWFGGPVTSAGCDDVRADRCAKYGLRGAEFYDEGLISSANMSPSATNPSYRNVYGTHAPELTGGVAWEAAYVPLPANNQDQEAAANTAGLMFGSSLDSLTLWAANSAGESPTRDASGEFQPPATHQFIQACTSKKDSSCTTYRYDDSGLLERRSGNGPNYTWTTVRANFNGVLYTQGSVDHFTGPARVPSNSNDPRNAPPALASFAQLTLAVDDNVTITGDLKYERPPCTGTPKRVDGVVVPAECDDLDAANVLGVYTQTGNINFGHNNSKTRDNAPYDVTVHGVLMTSRGRVQVEDYSNGGVRGSVNLLGGIIEYYYGAFGTFNAGSGNQSSGYSRAFTYDRRMSMGIEPPYFPTVMQDGVKGVSVFSFGQREQLY
ncbi:MAG: DUF4900 domain-containing protein [Truepera sp.]|jgi:hypothetical protein|nr:DUF4900 domain-containing protein [Truepera sp.]